MSDAEKSSQARRAVVAITEKAAAWRAPGAIKHDLLLTEENAAALGLVRLTDETDLSIPTGGIDLEALKPWTFSGEAKPSKNVRVSDFARNFYVRYPFLNGVPLDGLLIAGGSVARLLRRERGSDEKDEDRRLRDRGGDVDVFVYGEEDPTKRFERFARDLDVSLVENFAEGTAKFSAIRTANAVTISIQADQKKRRQCIDVQIILRHYSSAAEVLHGFDLGASQVGFDGANVWATEYAVACYGLGANIVDPARRSPTYERRLRKYARPWEELRFATIAPEIDPEAVTAAHERRPGRIVRLPHGYIRINRNTGDRNMHPYDDAPRSDYEPTIARHARASHNLRAICAGNLTGLLRGCGGLDSIAATVAKLRESRAIMLDEVAELQRRTRNRLLSRFEYRLLDRVPQQFVQRAVTAHLANDRAGLETVLAEAEAAYYAQHYMLQGLTMEYAWKRVDPGAQGSLSYTGSFHPTPMTAQEWYGEYHSPIHAESA